VKNTLPDKLPDNRGNRDTREGGERNATAIGPLVCLAIAVGLTTNALAPCLATAGLAGAAALLAATMAALFATLLAIVSFSVAAAIATMLLPPAAGAPQDTVFRRPLRNAALARASPGAAARDEAVAPPLAG